MAEFHENAVAELTIQRFEEWEHSRPDIAKVAFSKRVDRWVQELTNLSVEKPLVMKHAVQNVELDKVDKDPMLRLLDAIRSQLR